MHYTNYKVFNFDNAPTEVSDALEYCLQYKNCQEGFVGFHVDIEDYSIGYTEGLDDDEIYDEKMRMTLVRWLIENGAEAGEYVILSV